MGNKPCCLVSFGTAGRTIAAAACSWTVIAAFCGMLTLAATTDLSAEPASAQTLLSLDAKQIAGRVTISPEAQAWLDRKPTVRARVGTAAPLHSWTNGPEGIAVDYLRLVCQGFGVDCTFFTGMPWSEAIRNIATGDGIDLILTIKRTPERAREIAFTQDYLFLPWVIFTRGDGPIVTWIGDLDGAIVAVEKDFVLHDRLKADYPHLRLLVVEDSKRALEALATGQAAAYIGDLVTGAYLINRWGYANVKVVAPTPFGDHNQAMGVRPDWPGLVSLIDGFMAAMTAQERAAITNRWLAVRYEYGLDWLFVWKVIGGVVAVAALIVAVIVVWNRRLRTEIAHRKRIENALRESEKKFRHLIEFAPIGIFLSVDRKYIYTNPAGAKIVGLSDPGEIVGKSVTAFHHPNDKTRADRRVSQLLSGETSAVPRIEFKILKTDGSERDLDAVSTTLDWGGKLAVLAMVNDITDRKAAELALTESEERFFLALENIPDVIVIYDPGLRIRYINAATRRVTGRSPDYFVGKRDEELWPPEVCRAYLPTLQEAVRSGTVRSVETEITLPDREPRYLRITGVPVLDDAGTVREVLGITHDFTERKAMESQLRQAQKMEAVGQLAGGTAHDFNNLLQVIMGSLEMIRRRFDGDEQAMKFTDAAMKAARHGGKLTQQLLSFSRQQSLHPQTADPNTLVEGMIKMLRRVLGEDIDIETALEDGIPPVKIDPGGLENAILNLALNARAAMPKGGKLTVGTAGRYLEEDVVNGEERLYRGPHVEISVTDTGCGMPPDVMARVFEPFFTTKEVGEGSGLGMSMVYGFAKQSRGHTSLESEVGKGTTVRMIFPAAEPTIGDSKEVRKKAHPDAGTGTILVVEDDPDVRSTVVAVMKMLGYHTREAGDGRAALDALQSGGGIDLLFSDVVMPKGLDGIEMAREATRRHPGLKVLLTSGYPEATLEKAGLTEAGFPLLKKPYSNQDLAEALRAAFSRAPENKISPGGT